MLVFLKFLAEREREMERERERDREREKWERDKDKQERKKEKDKQERERKNEREREKTTAGPIGPSKLCPTTSPLPLRKPSSKEQIRKSDVKLDKGSPQREREGREEKDVREKREDEKEHTEEEPESKAIREDEKKRKGEDSSAEGAEGTSGRGKTRIDVTPMSEDTKGDEVKEDLHEEFEESYTCSTDSESETDSDCDWSYSDIETGGSESDTNNYNRESSISNYSSVTSRHSGANSPNKYSLSQTWSSSKMVKDYKVSHSTGSLPPSAYKKGEREREIEKKLALNSSSLQNRGRHTSPVLILPPQVLLILHVVHVFWSR